MNTEKLSLLYELLDDYFFKYPREMKMRLPKEIERYCDIIEDLQEKIEEKIKNENKKLMNKEK